MLKLRQIKHYRLCIVFFILFFTETCLAARLNDMFGVWGSLTLAGDMRAISPELSSVHWLITNQTRSRDDNHETTRFTENILFSQVGYQLNKNASVWIGYVHDWIEPLHGRNFQESRPYQDFVWKQGLGDFKLTLRTRMDERINLKSMDIGYRPRQLFKLSHDVPIIDHLSAYTGYEILFYLNNSRFGRTGVAENRVLAGLNYQLNRNFGINTGYMGQHVDQRRNNDIMTHNLFINMHYRF